MDLRGEKARFQSIGNAVNTAARMESLGQKYRIPISQTTEAALTEAARESWFMPIENFVTEKVKGQ
jgi:class 3 adenylate cyclase